MIKLFIPVRWITSLFSTCTVQGSTQICKASIATMSLSEAVSAINARYIELYKVGDMKTLATELYHEDCKLMMSGFEPIVGQKGVVERLDAMQRTGASELKLTSEEIDGIETDTAYCRGSYVFYKDDGSEMTVGKYLLILKKVDGKYRIYLDIDNSNN
ncbi:uncharacterized protein LOC100368337 [Saccoglossus kowalevskii]|uniref:Uncharacterized protein LOC100368337 n=1 Tax=Saccoglossus kowalevskii TaxID=10224 RepID=A0ABM0GU56_SACKO|nr:PREDICTED: uncharacterized protein LOC100368337 [Saccoglossus kowalevskii]